MNEPLLDMTHLRVVGMIEIEQVLHTYVGEHTNVVAVEYKIVIINQL